MFLLASICYAFSIFIDVSSYHIKYYIQDNNNVRYLLSLVNIFQYSARAFVLVFVPITAYYTETIRDKDLVWLIIFLAHLFVVFLLLPLFNSKFSSFFSRIVIIILNIVFGKSKKINLRQISIPVKGNDNHEETKFLFNLIFFLISFIAGFFFSIGITFLYYLSFSFPQKALTLSSYTQIINMVGSLIFVLFLDPKIMSSIDSEKGYNEIRLLTASRITVHISLILLLYYIK